MFGSLGQKFPKEFSVRRSLDVTPSRSATYVVDGGMFDAYGNSNVFNRHTLINEKAEDFLDLFISQNSMRNVSPLRHFPGMSPRVVDGRLGSAASFDGILSIMLLGPPSQMLGVAARWVIAGMERVRETFWCISMGKIARNPRGNYFDSPRSAAGYGKKPVSFPVSALFAPKPAIILSGDCYFAPKPNNIFFAKIKHVAAPLMLKEAYHGLGG